MKFAGRSGEMTPRVLVPRGLSTAPGNYVSCRAGRATRMKYLATDAFVSDDGLYRYWLSRRLSMGERSVAFVGLNPSTADGTKDDPTIRKCVGFAQRWGFDWLYMLNLYAWRSTDPKRLVRFAKQYESQAVGPENAAYLRDIGQRCELIIAAWGATPLTFSAKRLGAQILSLPRTRALRWTQAGRPWHPLYVPYSTTLQEVPQRRPAVEEGKP